MKVTREAINTAREIELCLQHLALHQESRETELLLNDDQKIALYEVLELLGEAEEILKGLDRLA